MLSLHRHRSTEQGTPGVLLAPGGARLGFTLELPWHDNARQRSCIPPGRYRVARVQTPRHGPCYEVLGVPDRSSILIHSGNRAGDNPPLRSDVLGCILLGTYFGNIDGQLAVLVSRPAVRRLEEAMQGNPFDLEIAWASF